MKTVLVFDTDDERGMHDAYKIMQHLCHEHLMMQLPSRSKIPFGKIEFVKHLRTYADKCLLDGVPNKLKEAKAYTDQVWNQKNRSKDVF